jgi:hypothetical protein
MARVSKSTSGLVSQTQPNNLLNILRNLNEQTDMLRMQNKQKLLDLYFSLNVERNMLCMNVHLITLKCVNFVQDYILLKISHHYQG